MIEVYFRNSVTGNVAPCDIVRSPVQLTGTLTYAALMSDPTYVERSFVVVIGMLD